MNTSTVLSLVGIASALVSAPAMASLSVQGSGGASWQAFPGALNNYANANRPYWDQGSKDGGNRNVGNYLTGSWTPPLPGGSAPSPNITPSWWGNASAPDFYASMDNNISFNLTPPSNQVGTTLRLELAGYSAGNIIGWYDTTDAPGAETLNVVYTGPNSPVLSVLFTPSANFGLYIQTAANDVFFSDSSRNRTTGGTALSADDRATQHFAVFQADATANNELYYIGVEDLRRNQAGVEIVGDYNDIIFSLRAVPTPGAMGLMVLGGLVAGRRRR